MKKILFIFTFLIYIFSFNSCNLIHEDNNDTIVGVVEDIDNNGDIITSFTSKDLKKIGLEYGDIIKVVVPNNEDLYIPYVSSYIVVGSGKPYFSKYSEDSTFYCFRFSQGKFNDLYNIYIGDKIIISIDKKHKYQELINFNIHDKREENETYESFSNFREISIGKILPKKLYRSTSPLNVYDNPIRYIYSDDFVNSKDIKTIIDINDNEDDILYMYNIDQQIPLYSYKNLFLSGNVIALGLNCNSYDYNFYYKYSKGMRFIIDKEPPYLICSNFGKDTYDLFYMIIEGLCEASTTEILDDFMQTYCNLYNIEKGSMEYYYILNNVGKRLLYLLMYPEDISKDILWEEAIKEIDIMNPKEASERFLKNYCKLSDLEINLLKNKLIL